MLISLELVIAIVSVLVILFVFVIIMIVKKEQRKKFYYKTVVDNSINIILFVNQKGIIGANNTFFKYFKNYATIEEFLKEHSCICEFFEEENEYLSSVNFGIKWINYLLKDKETKHKVKVKIGENIYYFLASASVVDKKKGISVAILSDITQQENIKRELEVLTINDGLTQIGNRRFFDEKLEENITLSQRYKSPFSLILFDIDFFKQVNDIHGHDVGDKVLIRYTEFISSLLREGDIFSRVGGEEFTLLLPCLSKDKAYALAQKVRKAVEDLKEIVPITMSFGVAEHERADDARSLYKRADLALYKAKEGGRNKVVLG